MALTHIQREQAIQSIALKAKGRFRTPNKAALPLEARPAPTIDQIRDLFSIKRMTERFEEPAVTWNFGVSRLTADTEATETDQRHLKHLGKASAMFDQFCVGISVDPLKKRLYVAFQREDLTAQSRLPDEDTVTQVMDELAVNSTASSFYTYMEHTDGSVTWCDFGSPDPVQLGGDDEAYCFNLLEQHDGGFVLVYQYSACFCMVSNDVEDMAKGVGVRIDGTVQTRHQISLPYRDMPMQDLVSQVGQYYRSLQSARTMEFVPSKVRNKNRIASKAQRKARKR